jgi:hypothetical protein
MSRSAIDSVGGPEGDHQPPMHRSAAAHPDIHDAERKLTRDNGGEKHRIGLGQMCFDHEAKPTCHHDAGNKARASRRQEGGAEHRGEQYGYGCRKR